jgi:uncharacterized protein
MKIWLTAIPCFLLIIATAVAHEDHAATRSESNGLKILVYSDTGYYRHPDIPKINRWLVLLGHENGMEVDITEHYLDLQPQVLDQYDVLLLNNANELDKVLPEEQRKSVEDWFAPGDKGVVALHAALVYQQKWPWLNDLGGCDFNSDSEFHRARVLVDPEAMDHPTIKGQPAEFWYEANWTNHDRTVTGRPGFQVLSRLMNLFRNGSGNGTASRWARTIRSRGPTNQPMVAGFSIQNSVTI